MSALSSLLKRLLTSTSASSPDDGSDLHFLGTQTSLDTKTHSFTFTIHIEIQERPL